MSEPAADYPRRRAPAVSMVGWALWLISLLWWYFYYSQYGGALELFEQKFVCLAVTTDVCLAIQQKLVMSAIPAYHPVLFWLGAILLVIGFLQRRSWRR
jgi:hypothetical protein